jgi:hypothetical protein
MYLIIVVLILLALFGGGGFYGGGFGLAPHAYWGAGGIGLLVIILIVFLLFQ